ncbi:MAG: phage tail tape measure protein, partial [Candidatus Aenigmatarchaeota archaeon]
TIFSEIQRQAESLKRKNISKELREALDMSKILEDFKMTTPEIKKDINMILKAAEKDLQKLAPEIENVAKKLHEAYKAQRKFEVQNLVKQESDVALALKRRSEKLDEIIIKEARLRTEISQGINVEQNRLELLRSLEQRQKLGLQLTEEQIREYKKLYAASLKLPKFRGIPLEEAKYETQLMVAKSITEAEKRRWAAVRKLRIEEAKLRAELQINMNVEQNRLALYQNLNKQKELGAKLTRDQARELSRLTKEQKKIQRRGSPFEMFSPAWFKMRLGWFIQLRAYWAAYRGLRDTIDDITESQKQLARALRTARSEWMSNTEIAEKYMKVMVEATVTHAADWQQSGEALYQLGSAGLSAEESLAAFNAVMSLAVATEGDLREVTKSVAGVYNNFGEQMDDVLSTEQKFQHIVNVMSTAWAKHQIEISELTDGYKYASAAAKMAGVSLEDLTAYLAVANDHMIKGSRAGRAFTTMISRISRAPEKFRKELGLIQEIDVTKPLKLSNIFKELHQRLVEGKTSVAELSVAFQNLGIRATPIFRVLLENYDEWEKARQDAHSELIKATDLEEKQLDNLGDQIKRLGGLWKKYIVQAVKPFTNWLKEQIKSFVDEAEIKDVTDEIRERLRSKDDQIIITDRQKEAILLRIETISTRIEKLTSEIKKAQELGGDVFVTGFDVGELNKLKKEREELVKALNVAGVQQYQKGLEGIREKTGKLAVGFKKLTKEQRQDLIKRFEKLKEAYGLEEKSKDVNKELTRLRGKMIEAEKERNKLINQALQTGLKEGTFGAKTTKLLESAADAQKRLNSLQREFNSKLGESNRKVSEINREIVNRLKTENKIRQIKIKDIDIEISKMTAGGIVTREEQKKINELLD